MLNIFFCNSVVHMDKPSALGLGLYSNVDANVKKQSLEFEDFELYHYVVDNIQHMFYVLHTTDTLTTELLNNVGYNHTLFKNLYKLICEFHIEHTPYEDRLHKIKQVCHESPDWGQCSSPPLSPGEDSSNHSVQSNRILKTMSYMPLMDDSVNGNSNGNTDICRNNQTYSSHIIRKSKSDTVLGTKAKKNLKIKFDNMNCTVQ